MGLLRESEDAADDWAGSRVKIDGVTTMGNETILAAEPMRLEEPSCRRGRLGAVLIGGGEHGAWGLPKHLAFHCGETMLERILRVVDPSVDRTVVVGRVAFRTE